MNDNKLEGVTDLLDRATHDLVPNTARLIQAGTARGRRLQRRRRATTGLATLAVLGAVASVVPMLGAGGGVGDSQVTVATVPEPVRRDIAVPAEEMASTLARLLPGDDPRTDLTTGTDSDGLKTGTLTWHGAHIRIGIDDTPDPIVDAPGTTYDASPTPSPRPAPTTPQAWCLAVSGTCGELPNGDWASSNDAAEPGNPGNWQRTFVLYTTDGYMVLASSIPLRPDENGTPATQPVLTVAQLRDIAESDVWLS